MNWYIGNESWLPDVVAACNTKANGAYVLRTESLPTNPDSQREQLVRRLAAKDDAIDLIGMDVVWTGEFAQAGWITPFSSGELTHVGSIKNVLKGPFDSAVSEGQQYGAPLNSNTRLLWYHKSVLGDRPVPQTWDQLLDTAEALHTTIQETGKRSEALVVLFTVPDPAALRSCLNQGCRRQGWPSPRWLQTTPEDPGTRMAARAVDQGVDLVVCCGGDGTVRAVAAALAGTGVPLGVVPTGTGNLLARNLNLPLDLAAAVEVALTGRDQRLDVGVAGDERFVVMAGVGFDAAMVADAPPALKARLGWPAYVLSAARHLRDRPMVLRLRVDGGAWRTQLARGVVVGNVGQLQGGIALLPDADPADGLLDVAVLGPIGLWGWARVAGRVLSGSATGNGLLERFQAHRLELHTRRPQPHELDGDPHRPAARLLFEVAPAALTVRVPW